MIWVPKDGIGVFQVAMSYTEGRDRMYLKHTVTYKHIELYVKLFAQHYSSDLHPGLLTIWTLSFISLIFYIHQSYNAGFR